MTVLLNDYRPPCDLGAEQSTLGAMMIEPEAIDRAAEILAATDFYREAHRRLFLVMLDMRRDMRPVDIVTIQAALTDRGWLAAVGGPPYLAALLDRVPTAANVDYYAKIVHEKSKLRRAVEAALETIEAATGSGEDGADDVISRAESLFFSLRSDSVRAEGQGAMLGDLIDEIESGRARGAGRLPTGYASLDAVLSGGWANGMNVVGAQPSMGKSSLVLGSSVLNASQGRPVFVSSHEKEAVRVALDALVMTAQAPKRDVLRQDFGDFTRASYREWSRKMRGYPLWIESPSDNTVSGLRSRVRRFARDHGQPAMIVVDYLQLFEERGHAGNRVGELDAISRSLAQMGRDEGCALVVVSSVTDEAGGPNTRPGMKSCRDCKSIAYAADTATFLWGRWWQEKDSPGFQANARHETEVIVRKNKDGGAGTAFLDFIPAYARFESRADPFADDYTDLPDGSTGF